MRCIDFLNKKEMIEMNYISMAVVAVFVVVVVVDVVGVVFRNMMSLTDITFKAFNGLIGRKDFMISLLVNLKNKKMFQ